MNLTSTSTFTLLFVTPLFVTLFRGDARAVTQSASPEALALDQRDVPKLKSGFALNSLEQKIYFEIHGNAKGPGVFFLGISPSSDYSTEDRQGYLQRFGDRYRLLFADYPLGLGKSDAPKDPTSMTAKQVCDDLVAIADEAGFQRFALVGYSWGGNASLQAATRSNRVSALVVGGWPALDGPYQQSLQTTLRMAKDAEQTEAIPGINGAPGIYWQQFVTYYQSLQGWTEREAVAEINCPRLNYTDEEDMFEAFGIKTDLVGPLRRNEETLKQLGWEVAYIKSGSGHMGGFRPDTAGPLIEKFLDQHLISSGE